MLTIEQKAKILCGWHAEAEEDDGNWFETLWDGVTGYGPPVDDERHPEYKEWVSRIEEEWIDAEIDDMDEDMLSRLIETYAN